MDMKTFLGSLTLAIIAALTFLDQALSIGGELGDLDTRTWVRLSIIIFTSFATSYHIGKTVMAVPRVVSKIKG